MNSTAAPSTTRSNASATWANFQRAHAALAEEHEQIIKLLGDINETDGRPLMIAKLDRLHTLLVNHFAREQFPGGLYESMGAFGSRWHDLLRELIREHCEILSDARAVLERARNASPDQENALHDNVVALAEKLFEHEQKEHCLAGRLRSIVRDGTP